MYRTLYYPNSTKLWIPQFVHPNRNWNWIPSIDSNRKYHIHSNNRIGIGDQFISISDLVFQLQFNSRAEYQHPNTALAFLGSLLLLTQQHFWFTIIFWSPKFSFSSVYHYCFHIIFGWSTFYGSLLLLCSPIFLIHYYFRLTRI